MLLCICCNFHLYKCRTPAPACLRAFSWGWGLPTLGCLCNALPNIKQIPRPTGVWPKGISKFIQEGIRNRTEPAEPNRTGPRHDASEKHRPNRVEPGNTISEPNRTKPNGTDEISKVWNRNESARTDSFLSDVSLYKLSQVGRVGTAADLSAFESKTPFGRFSLFLF